MIHFCKLKPTHTEYGIKETDLRRFRLTKFFSKTQLEPGQRPMFTRQELIRLIIPLMIEQLLAITIGMADSVMVASCGEASVSGVSLVDSINVLLINVFSALTTGGRYRSVSVSWDVKTLSKPTLQQNSCLCLHLPYQQQLWQFA